MIVGLVLLVLGFTIMAMDKEPYGFGFLGLTLSPIIVLAGFITEIFAILYTPKQKDWFSFPCLISMPLSRHSWRANGISTRIFYRTYDYCFFPIGYRKRPVYQNIYRCYSTGSHRFGIGAVLEAILSKLQFLLQTISSFYTRDGIWVII